MNKLKKSIRVSDYQIIRLLGLAVVCLLVLVGYAEANTSLDLGVAGIGARPLGMGRAYVAVADDANAVFTNPAGLGLQKNWSITSMSTQLYGNSNYVLAGASIPVAFGTLGIGYIGLQTPAGYQVDSANSSVGAPISYNSSELVLSYARNLKDVIKGSFLSDLSVGASVKVINNSFGGFSGSGQGTGMDLGVIFTPNNTLSLGATFSNVGGKVNWASGKQEEVEGASKFGGSLKLLGGKLLASAGVDFAINAQRPAILHGGIEYRPIEFLSIRGGLDQDPVNLNQTVSNLTAGVGIKMAGISFDYAYKQDKEIETNARHYFSISLSGDGAFPFTAKKEIDKEKLAAVKDSCYSASSRSEGFISIKNTTEKDQEILNYYK